GARAEDPELLAFDELIKTVDQKPPQGLVPAFNERVIDAGVFDPLLRQSWAKPAPEAEKIAIRMLGNKALPGFNSLCLDVAGNQLVTQFDGLILAFFLVADTNAVPLFVVHQGRIYGTREAAFGVLH